jgi:hypothetical protein
VVSGLLRELGGRSDLKMELREDVGDGPSGVELFGSFVEELLKHVEEPIILLSVDSRVFDDEAAIGMQGLRNGFAVLMVVA